MNIGIAINDIWDFFHDVYSEFETHHHTTLFKRNVFNLPILNTRFNRYRLEKDMRNFMRSNEVVFFEWASELLAVASYQPKTCGLVTRMHRYDIYEWIDKVRWDAVDKIILVSKAKQVELSSKLPEHAHKIVVIPEAVSLEKFKPSSKPFGGDIGILCHLKPRKRVYDLVLSFYEMTKKHDGLHLHIGGDMRPAYVDYHEALHRLVANLNIQDKVTFYGHVAQPEEWYRNIDIFISNSYSEGLQVSPMESIASGCYCLSHFWDGADELLPAENLFYTSSELIDKVLEYTDLTESERKQKQAALLAMVRDNFDVGKTRVQIRELVEEVANAR